MIEFAFILPMFTFMLLLSLDMGHLMMVRGAMADATFAAARTGAQIGGAGLDSSGGQACKSVGNCPAGSTWIALSNDVRANVPGYNAAWGLTMNIKSGARCKAGKDDHVAIDVAYTVVPITPGLGAMLNMAGGGAGPGMNWRIHTVAIARCEVIRSP